MIRFFSRPRRERGAVAIIVAALAIVLFGVAALGVDIASQVNRKHLLKNQLDAAATAAAFYLDTDTTGIRDAATNAISYFAKNGQGTLDPSKIDFWCVVARKLNTDNTPATPAQVAAYQIPTATQTAGVCNPDAASSTTDWKMSDYQNRVRYDGQVFKMTCNSTLCAVPCALQARPANNWSPGLSVANNRPITCNTIRVGAQQNVPFDFAPVIGVDQGSTGAQIAVACKGSCGAVASNPMNVVIVTDRTNSMCEADGSCPDEHDMIAGIRSLLQKMSPEQQFVSLATIGRSKGTSRASFSACSTTDGVDFQDNMTASMLWVPLKFHNNYLTSTGALNGNSNLVKALNCLDPNVSGWLGNTNGTYLAAPLKQAARYVLNLDTANYNVESELSGSSRSGNVRNLIIFETDGQPFEYTGSANDSCGVANSLTITVSGCGNGYDVFSDLRRSTTPPATTTTDPGCPAGARPNSTVGACETNYITCSTAADTIGTSGTFDGACWNPQTSYTSSSSCTSRGFSWGKPTGSGSNACWKRSSSSSHTITYKTKTSQTTTTYSGGQQACANFDAVADTFKAYNPNNIVITVGYNLNNSTLCGGQNLTSSGNNPAWGTTTSTPYLSGVTDSNGNSLAGNATCVSGNGSSGTPYVLKDGCNQNVILTFSQNSNSVVQGSGNDPVPSVLASAAGGQGLEPSTNNNNCNTTAGRTAENADGDYFFCAASGDDMGSIFVTALSQVSSGVKLINMPH